MQIIRKQQVENESNVLEQIKFRYLPYWPLFLLLFAVAISVAWVYVKFQVPAYAIGAKLLIKDEKKGAEESKTLEELNVISPKKTVENEMEIIRSKPIINKVVKDLGLYALTFEETSFGPRSAYLTSPVTITALTPDSINPAQKVAYQYDDKNATVIMNSTNYKLDKWYSTPYGQLQFSKNINQKEYKNKGKFYFSLIPVKGVANAISAGLQITAPNKLSSIIELGYVDEVRERGENILNNIIDAYNSVLVTEKGDIAVNTLGFIDERLKKVKHDLDSIESLKKQYRTVRGAVDISAQGQMYLDNVGYNDQKLSEVNMQLSVLNRVESYVQSREGNGKIVPSTLGVNDQVLSTMVSNLYQKEIEYSNQVKTAGDNNPLTLALAKEISDLRPGIMENIRNQKNSLQASRSSFSATNGNFNSMLSQIPETERRLVQIERDQKLESGIYTFLLQKREEAALSQINNNDSNSRVVDRAEASESPVSPKKKLVYMSAVLLALIAGTGIVMGKEKAGNKIMFRKDIEALTELPIIGEIAAEDSKNPIVIDDRRKTVIAEQFRKLRATLGYIGVDTQHKRILVTSSISGEGKSFVATNLAISLAITGKKVVLLDFDLNNPSLNNKLNIKNQKGITDYLLDKESIGEIVMKTDLHENLSLISTGKLPFNPSELIMNKNVEKLFAELNEQFDYIVIDTAPVVPVTDAYLLSEYCDATLFIVRHNYSPKILVEMFDENNRLNNLKNAAIVFNGVKPRGFGRKSYTYGYGYTSGYQYSNGYIQKQVPKGSIGNK